MSIFGDTAFTCEEYLELQLLRIGSQDSRGVDHPIFKVAPSREKYHRAILAGLDRSLRSEPA